MEAIDEVYNPSSLMERKDILVLFKGVFSSELLTSLLQASENQLKNLNEKPKIRKRVFNILVECLQNVYLHMDKEGIDGSALFLLGKGTNNYYIVTTNQILRQKADELKERIEHLSTLSDNELRDLHNEILLNEEMDEKGGAGLGLVNIMRKSNNDIDYQFDKGNDKHCFFTLQVNVAN